MRFFSAELSATLGEMIRLGVNIDHVATIRQARYRDQQDAFCEPDPVRAAHEAELGGADGITVHLREDRRHICDRDVERLREMVAVKLNLEMAATDEMVAMARKIRPDTVMLVPEGRREVTTEGGLDVVGQVGRLTEVVGELRGGGMLVSAFIDPQESQIEASAGCGFDICEVHTGEYARVWQLTGGDERRDELAEAFARVRLAGDLICSEGMRFNAGHGLNYHNVGRIAALAGIEELHIGHSIVSRSVFSGMRVAVADMKRLMAEASHR